MVGQRFVSLLNAHPLFDIGVVAASPASCGKPYRNAVMGRWTLDGSIPVGVGDMVVDSVYNIEEIAAKVDFVFSALTMP